MVEITINCRKIDTYIQIDLFLGHKIYVRPLSAGAASLNDRLRQTRAAALRTAAHCGAGLPHSVALVST